MFDVTIIGAGVIGAYIARELSRYELNVAVMKEHVDKFSYQESVLRVFYLRVDPTLPQY